MTIQREVVLAALGEQALDDSSVRERLPPQVDGVYSYLRRSLPRVASFQLAIDIAKCFDERPRDVSLVWPRFALWLLTDPTDGVVQLAAVRRVSCLYERVCMGHAVPSYEWEAAKKDGVEAEEVALKDGGVAAPAARVAARAAWMAAEAARAEGGSAARAAWAVVAVAASLAVWGEARDPAGEAAAVQQQARKLLKLVQEAPWT